MNNIQRREPNLLSYWGDPHGEGSISVVDFKANVESYFIAQSTGLVTEGNKGFQEVETIWTFQLNHGKWLLNNVESAEFRFVYLNLTNEVPCTVLQSPNA